MENDTVDDPFNLPCGDFFITGNLDIADAEVKTSRLMGLMNKDQLSADDIELSVDLNFFIEDLYPGYDSDDFAGFAGPQNTHSKSIGHHKDAIKQQKPGNFTDSFEKKAADAAIIADHSMVMPVAANATNATIDDYSMLHAENKMLKKGIVALSGSNFNLMLVVNGMSKNQRLLEWWIYKLQMKIDRLSKM